MSYLAATVLASKFSLFLCARYSPFLVNEISRSILSLFSFNLNSISKQVRDLFPYARNNVTKSRKQFVLAQLQTLSLFVFLCLKSCFPYGLHDCFTQFDLVTS